MKQKFLFGLLGLLVCMFTMTACSSDDDDNTNNGTTSEVKLTSMEWGSENKINYIYDEQGRIKKLSYYYYGGKDSTIYDYTYQDNKIVVEKTNNGYKSIMTEYTLNNGLIVEALGKSGGKSKFAYDKDRQLVSIIEEIGKTTDEISINWKDGNIESYTAKEGSGSWSGSEQWQATCTCQYTSESAAKGFLVNVNIGGLANQEILFKLGYFGKQSKNLPSAVHFENSSYSSDYTYSYGFEGKGGYVSSCIIKNNGSSEKVVKFTWE